jgi:putative thioredoxin
VRKRLLEYFDLLGADDPRVPDARRRLARVLF